MMRLPILVICTLLFAFEALAQLQPQGHPAQFISYWKADVITAEQDAGVALAESVFTRLLRTWDSTRHEPGLYIVDSDQGPWAVSLVDGNILLSRQAIETCRQFGEQRAPHLLAFILGHELAHQRADDLWQHRFFRLDKDNPFNPQASRILSAQLDKRLLGDMQQKEYRADHDGLLLMASVGFDPYQIVGEQNFFTQWVESIWQQPCDAQTDDTISMACDSARQRALRGRSQLNTVASQSSLYQLGIQAMVANDHSTARRYFAQFARDFPSRAVMIALAITHLAEAAELRRQMLEAGLLEAPDLYFPLMLDASAGLQPSSAVSSSPKRGDSERGRWQSRLEAHSEKAVAYLEKAIRLAPDYRPAYQLLAHAYIVGGNSYMARGILQGRYTPRFGEDTATRLLLAMTSSVEKEHDEALAMLERLSQRVTDLMGDPSAAQDVLIYATFYNLVALQRFTGHGAPTPRTSWTRLARVASQQGRGYLFQLALAQIQQPGMNTTGLSVAPTINGLRLGNRKSRDDTSHTIAELWIEGDQHHVYSYATGAQFITGMDGRIISASQSGGDARLGGIRIGDDAERSLQVLGMPDRRLQLVSGEFLAYDQYGLAVRVDDDAVLGWFLY